uniref:Uncharacterized protein AlNc14C70G4855 n=1 Tax=Albugo laibachii Nc14 TaxID=890382 RepID=F0WDY7_9STRA|nr:conserved hypothetical protein [Albugo laibachii Nc14]|eukprot:CCA19415.1 conserved hypothetical protein [Albugo laibachii Nc14]
MATGVGTRQHLDLDRMNAPDSQRFYSLVNNRQALSYFEDEIYRFQRSSFSPSSLLRRFSLNGDGQLDMREFILAMKRLEIIVDDEREMGTIPASAGGREMFLLFCPTSSRKLGELLVFMQSFESGELTLFWVDIDFFCRIMKEWYSKLMQLRQQQGSSMISKPSSPKNTARSPVFTPYAVENPNQTVPDSFGDLFNDENVYSKDTMSEATTLWKRIRGALVQNLDKLSQLFFRMDVTCCGSISLDEFELALSHIGVHLTANDLNKFYAALSSKFKDFSSHFSSINENQSAQRFGIRYATLLSAILGQHTTQQNTITNGTITSRPITPDSNRLLHSNMALKSTTRLWDVLQKSLERLEPILMRYIRTSQCSVSADTFRDCLLRSGVALSNSDYAGLRVLLLPFTDVHDCIVMQRLLHALKYQENYEDAELIATGIRGTAPLRTGKKTIFKSESPFSTTPIAAGKTNEERNAAATRTLVKLCDENRWKDDVQKSMEGYDSTGKQQRNETVDGDRAEYTLEKRILARLDQLQKQMNYLNCTVETIFPGDRFGRISSGQLRQSLVQVNMQARHSEIETLFWSLDPKGHGFIMNHDLYNHLHDIASSKQSRFGGKQEHHMENTQNQTKCTNSNPSHGNVPHLSISTSVVPKGRQIDRAVQKVLEELVQKFSDVVQRCYELHNLEGNQGPARVTKNILLRIIYDLGILGSPSDLEAAVSAILENNHLEQTENNSQGIDLQHFESRLNLLTSDLLSPRNRRNHCSTTSVLLAPMEDQGWRIGSSVQPGHHTGSQSTNNRGKNISQTRRRMNQSHPATRSTIEITERDPDGREDNQDTFNVERHLEAPLSGYCRQRTGLLAIISIIQDILERRAELKSIMNYHRNTGVNGDIPVEDLAEIFVSSRLGLNFSTASTSGISVQDFLRLLFSPEEGASQQQESYESIEFLELLRRLSSLYSRLTKEQGAHIYKSRGKENDFELPMQSTSQPSPETDYKRSALYGSILQKLRSNKCQLRDLLFPSRHSTNGLTYEQKQSAAILLRHQFKAVAATSQGVISLPYGDYESICTLSNLRNICYRLGLDLTSQELELVMKEVDSEQSGYFSSLSLLYFFFGVVESAGHVQDSQEGSKFSSLDRVKSTADNCRPGSSHSNSSRKSTSRSVASSLHND